MPKFLPHLNILNFALVTALGLLLGTTKTVDAATDVKLYLSPGSGTFDSPFDVKVMLDSGTQTVGAVDVYLNWEPADLGISASDISAASGFTVAGKSVDEGEKQISFTVYKSEEFSGNSIQLATLTFSPKKSSGVTTVNYIFKGPGESGDSGVFYNGDDVLTSVSGATFTLAGTTTTQETHKECRDEACVEVSGAGSDECSQDSECRDTGTGGAAPEEDSSTSSDTSPDSTTGTTSTSGTDTTEAMSSAATQTINTAGKVELAIFLAIFSLSLISGGILWQLLP